MKTTTGSCCLLLLWIATLASQSLQPRFERQVYPGGAGANRLVPDVALFTGASYSDLRDLRFYDAVGKDVPYLLIPPATPEPRWITGKVLPVAATKTTSGFEVDLGSPTLVDALRLMGIPAPFLKRFRLEGSGDRNHWTLLVAEGTLFDLPDERLRLTDVGFTSGEFRYLRVTWDDRKSGVVPEPRSASGRLVKNRTPATPLRANARFERLSAGAGRSRFQVRLPGPHLPIAAVELNVDEPRLLRNVRITESQLSGAEIIPQMLGSATLHRVAQGDLVAADMRIPIRFPEGREIEIDVDDENNPPLALTGVVLEFTPQPWIYFESPAGAPLTARFGDPKLTAPRYDLEAVRQYIGRADLKEARWNESHDLQPAEASGGTGIEPEVGATIDPKLFRYSRQIPNSPAGLTALLMDAAVLAHSRPDLGDVRIVDANNHQIPYLLERRQDDLIVNLPPLVRDPASTAARSQHRLALPFENLPQAKLVLTTNETLFQRSVSVQVKRGPADARSEPHIETVATATWHHSDPDTSATPFSLNLPSSLQSTASMVIVEEGDNHPLKLTGARLELPLYRLRFFYPADGKLTLLYGQDGLAAPRYDLQLLAPRLVGVSSRELTLDKESSGSASPANNKLQTQVFWAALAVSVVVILFLLVRLLQSEKR